jgi:hypothetical protein
MVLATGYYSSINASVSTDKKWAADSSRKLNKHERRNSGTRRQATGTGCVQDTPTPWSYVINEEYNKACSAFVQHHYRMQ